MMLSKWVTSSLTATILVVLKYLIFMVLCLNNFGDRKYLSGFSVFFLGVFCFEGPCVSLFCLSSSLKHVWLLSLSNNIWPRCLEIKMHEIYYLCFSTPTFLLKMIFSCTYVFSHSSSRRCPDGSQPNNTVNEKDFWKCIKKILT